MESKTRSMRGKCLSFLLALALVVQFLPGFASATSDNTFTFSDTGITVSGSGSGYEIDGTDLKITESGVYTLTGSCAEGSVTVKKEVTGVTLILNGLTLTSSTTAPITCNKSTEVTIEVIGTNTLTNNEDIANEDIDENFEGAGIKVKSGGSLLLTGTGTLNVNGNCKNGIKGGATTVITVSELTLNVTAANNALASDGSVVVESGTISLTAENDGLKSEPDEDDADSVGSVTVNGGTISIDAVGDGIQAKSAININGGTIAIDADDDGINSAGDVTIASGSLTISAGDDGIHADYTLNIGVKDSSSGPVITVTDSVEGLEGAIVNLYSGGGTVYATDDGINAANSDLANYDFAINVYGGNWYINAEADGLDSNKDIYLYGGVIEAFGSSQAAESALDFDGSCYYEGGTILAVGITGMAQVPTSGTYVSFGTTGMNMGGGGGFGQGNMGDERPDGGTMPDGTTLPDGGTLPDGTTLPEDGSFPQQGERPNRGEQDGTQITPDTMAQREEMEQNGGMGQGMTEANSAISISAGSTIVIKDESGNTIYSATGVKYANCVVFASEDLVSGATYTLYVDDEAVATATAAEGTGGNTVPGGTPGDTAGGEGGTQEPDSSFPFLDVDRNSWYYSAVRYVFDRGIMQGTSSASFGPEGTLTRSALAQILYNMEENPEAGEEVFPDVASGAWYYKAVNWAAATGIVSGYDDGTFGPEDPVTREQMATILYRYAQYKGHSTDQSADLSGYTDASAISDYAMEAMQWINAEGIITGTTETTLSPQGTATRGQAATIFMRYGENNGL